MPYKSESDHVKIGSNNRPCSPCHRACWNIKSFVASTLAAGGSLANSSFPPVRRQRSRTKVVQYSSAPRHVSNCSRYKSTISISLRAAEAATEAGAKVPKIINAAKAGVMRTACTMTGTKNPSRFQGSRPPRDTAKQRPHSPFSMRPPLPSSWPNWKPAS